MYVNSGINQKWYLFGEKKKRQQQQQKPANTNIENIITFHFVCYLFSVRFFFLFCFLSIVFSFVHSFVRSLCNRFVDESSLIVSCVFVVRLSIQCSFGFSSTCSFIQCFIFGIVLFGDVVLSWDFVLSRMKQKTMFHQLYVHKKSDFKYSIISM